MLSLVPRLSTLLRVCACITHAPQDKILRFLFSRALLTREKAKFVPRKNLPLYGKQTFQSIKHNAGKIGHYFTGVWHRVLLRMHSGLVEKTADRVSEDVATLAVSSPVSLVPEKVQVKAPALRAIRQGADRLG